MPNIPLGTSVGDARVQQVVAGVSSSDAEDAYRRVQELNSQHIAKLRQERETASNDIARYYAADAEVAARYQAESVEAQLKSLKRLADERKAFSDEARKLERDAQDAVREGLDVEVQLGEKAFKQWQQILEAKSRLFKEHQEQIDQARKAAAAREQAEAENRQQSIERGVSVASMVGSSLASTSQGVPGANVLGMLGSDIAKIATASNTWERIYAVLQLTVDAAVAYYKESLQLTREQISAASGSGQLQRYLNDPTALKTAERIQAELKYSGEVRAEDRNRVAEVLGQIQKGGQGTVDISGEGIKRDLVAISRTAQILDVDFGKFSRTVAEVSRNTDQSLSQVNAAFLQAAGAIDEYNRRTPQEQISQIQFTSHVQQMAEALKSQRYSIEDVTSTTLKWAKALDDGTVSVGQIVQAMRGFSSADVGTLSFLAPGAVRRAQARAQSPEARRYFDALARQNAVNQGEGLRAGGQGVQGAPTIARILGVNPGELSKEGLLEIEKLSKDQAREELNSKVRQLGGGNLLVERMLEERLASGLGISVTGQTEVARKRLLSPLYGERGAATIETRGGPVALDSATVAKAAQATSDGIGQLNRTTESIYDLLVRSTWGRAVIAGKEAEERVARGLATGGNPTTVFSTAGRSALPTGATIDAIQRRLAQQNAEQTGIATAGIPGLGTALQVAGTLKLEGIKDEGEKLAKALQEAIGKSWWDKTRELFEQQQRAKADPQATTPGAVP